MPLYKVMYEGNEPPKPRKLVSDDDKGLWGYSRKEAIELSQLQRNLAKMDPKKRILLLGFAARLARHAAK
jgi:hypothetical protein